MLAWSQLLRFIWPFVSLSTHEHYQQALANAHETIRALRAELKEARKNDARDAKGRYRKTSK